MTLPGATPALTVVIPTRDRPQLLVEAIDSALGQSMRDLEVVVADDGSDPPVVLPADRRLRLVRLPTSRGNGASRNAGLAAARGRWVTCLDDDDLLLSHHGEVSLKAWEQSSLPPPVGVVSAVHVIGSDGGVVERRRPPTRPAGCCYSLEPIERGWSYNAKQTLVVETEVLRSIGGWDEAFRSRTVTELFLRLNQACSLQGLDEVTYQLRQHSGPRVSRDPALRLTSFDQLVAKHRGLFEAHPQRYAELLVDHALMSLDAGHRRAAALATVRASRLAPMRTARYWRHLARAAVRSVLPRRG